MTRARSPKRELTLALVSAAISLLAALDVYHEPARLVHILTIFVGGAGTGMAMDRAVRRWRGRRRQAPPPSGGDLDAR